jgi:hypothetical protein
MADAYTTFEEFQESAKDACARIPLRLFGLELQLSFDFDNMNGECALESKWATEDR